MHDIGSAILGAISGSMHVMGGDIMIVLSGNTHDIGMVVMYYRLSSDMA